MKEQANGAVSQLNTRYYAAHVGNPLDLLRDSQWLLERARRLIDITCVAVEHPPELNPTSLATAISCVSLLVEMGAEAVCTAHTRLQSCHSAMP